MDFNYNDRLIDILLHFVLGDDEVIEIIEIDLIFTGYFRLDDWHTNRPLRLVLAYGDLIAFCH